MRIAALFPGQGSQFEGMADPWTEHPASARTLEEASRVLGWDVVERTRDADALARTEVVQPAVFVCDLAANAVLRDEGVDFDFAAGHSLGEYAALVAAGVLEFSAALEAVIVRANSMGAAAAAAPGAMTAVLGLSPEDARELAQTAGRGDVLTVANENAPKQIVLSGSIAAVERAEQLARTRGGKVIRLQVAGAFHSPLMQPSVGPIRDAISRLEFRPPRFPIVPNASGKPTTHPLALRDLLARHVTSPVRWEAGMRAMAHSGVTSFVEVGPGDVLAKLARRAVPGAKVRTVASPADAAEAARELRDLAVAEAGARP